MTEPASPTEHGHCVHVALGAVVCAVPIYVVVGVRLFGEVQLRTERGGLAQDDCRLAGHVVLSERNRYAAWDFYTLLGLREAPSSSWLLMNIPHGTRRVPVALRVGRCLGVEPVGSALAVPAAAFRDRPRALCAVFDARHIRAHRAGVLGLSCDPTRLFSERELDESQRRVESRGRSA